MSKEMPFCLRASLKFFAILIALVTVTMAITSRAQTGYGPGSGNGLGWYARGEIGGEIMPNSRLRLSLAPSEATVKFDPGVRFDAAGGYTFCRYFSLEGQAGILYNSIHSISGSSAGDASLGQFPILANAVFQWPNASHWTPYIGGGCGLVVSEIDFHHTTIQGNALHGNAAAATFGYQGFAGVRYELDSRWNISLGYSYLGTTQPSWDVKGPGSDQTIGTLVLRHPQSHALMAGFVLRF